MLGGEPMALLGWIANRCTATTVCATVCQRLGSWGGLILMFGRGWYWGFF